MRTIWKSLAAAAAFLGWQTAAQATVQIHVDLSSQVMHVTSSSGSYDWAVSTGRAGHRTPTGVYHPQRMYTMTYSHKYDDAPMPHAIFFYGGYAIHGTYATNWLGHVASHGCIRLSPGNAATLFSLVKNEGATIVISGQAPGGGAVVAHHGRHSAGHRLAMHWRKHYRTHALAFAPHPHRRHARSLRAWANNPIENQ